ncbi:hypothetical protein [Streptacidiphilus sp. MAP5-3]|uniref:hypothetical protein n=1 Tax=unclassified Streptacidiphilus TaxID=2643834 RepID=UPI0035148F60
MNAPIIRPLAAAHFRDALTAAQTGDLPTALGALLAIDDQSWQGIRARLDDLGPTVAALVARTLGGGA